jgi:hypothetical protein
VRVAEKVAAVVAVVLHVVVGVFPYAASGLLAPLWGIVLLYGVWLALAVVLVRLLRPGPRRRPMVAPVVPFVALAAWFAVLSLGEALFDWTA